MRSTSGGSRDVEVRDPVRWCGHHIDGRPRGEALPPQDSGVEVVDAISAVPSFLVRAEGPHCCLRVRHQPVNPLLCRQPAGIREEGHRLPLLGGAHS